MAINLVKIRQIGRAYLLESNHLLNRIAVKENRWDLNPVSGNVFTVKWFGEFESFSSKAFGRFEVLSPFVLILLLIHCGLVTP